MIDDWWLMIDIDDDDDNDDDDDDDGDDRWWQMMIDDDRWWWWWWMMMNDDDKYSMTVGYKCVQARLAQNLGVLNICSNLWLQLPASRSVPAAPCCLAIVGGQVGRTNGNQWGFLGKSWTHWTPNNLGIFGGSPYLLCSPPATLGETREKKKHIMTCKNIMQSYHIYAAHGHDMPLPKSSAKFLK